MKSFALVYFKRELSGYFCFSIPNLVKVILFFLIKMKELFINWLVQMMSEQSIRFISGISDNINGTVLLSSLFAISQVSQLVHLYILIQVFLSFPKFLASIFLSQRQHHSISGIGYTMRALEVFLKLWRLTKDCCSPTHLWCADCSQVST